MKWLPLLVFSMSAYKGKDYFKSVMNVSSSAIVQIELQSIAQVITLNLVDGENPNPENFGEYLRKNMRKKTETAARDLANDMWGTPYKLEVNNTTFVVRSAGPDKQFGNSDDVAVAVSNSY